jgi:hypothetical protein
VDQLVDRQALLEALGEAGYEAVTPRVIESWIYQGLLPRPVRVGNTGQTPQWRYPPETPDQVVAICRWRTKTRAFDAIRVAIWLEGFDQEVGRVRESLHQVLDELGKHVRDVFNREGGIQAVSRRIAAARGERNPLPRVMPVGSLETRSHAVEALLRLVVCGETSTMDHSTAVNLERVLGLRRGRFDGTEESGPWLTGQPEDIAQLVPNLESLADAVAEASDETMLAARPLASVVALQLPMFAKLTSAFFGMNFAGLELLNRTMTPQDVSLVLALFVGLLGSDIEPVLRGVAHALDDTGDMLSQLGQLAALPAADLAEALQQVPSEQREGLRRAVEAFRSTP